MIYCVTCFKRKMVYDSILHQMYAFLYSRLFHRRSKHCADGNPPSTTTRPRFTGSPLPSVDTTNITPTEFQKPNFTIIHMMYSDHYQVWTMTFRSTPAFCFSTTITQPVNTKISRTGVKLYINSSPSNALQAERGNRKKKCLLTWLSTVLFQSSFGIVDPSGEEESSSLMQLTRFLVSWLS